MPWSEQDLQLMEKLAGIPAAVDDLQGVVAKHIPEAAPREYVAKKQVREEFQAALDAQSKKIEELTNLLNTQNTQRQWETDQDKIKKLFGWDDAKMKQFQEDFASEFKEKKTLAMEDLAEYYELKNRPLAPASNPRLGPFGIRHEQSSQEAKWREDMRDPKSPMFSKNKRERKAYWRGQWKQAQDEMHALGIK
jgi:hypothetical protein